MMILSEGGYVMLFSRKNCAEEIYLECYSMNGCVYRVIGCKAHYRVEIGHGSQKCRIAELRTLAKAHALALRLLDNGAVPKSMTEAVGA